VVIALSSFVITINERLSLCHTTFRHSNGERGNIFFPVTGSQTWLFPFWFKSGSIPKKFTISAEEVREIEVGAAPAREKVRKLFEAYRPEALADGNTERDRDAAISESVRESLPTIGQFRAAASRFPVLRCRCFHSQAVNSLFAGKRAVPSINANCRKPANLTLLGYRPLPDFRRLHTT